MANLIDLPAEVLIEICYYVCLHSGIEMLAQIPEDVDIFAPDEYTEAGDRGESLRSTANLVSTYSNSKVLKNSFVTGIDAVHHWPGADLIGFFQSILRLRCIRKPILALSLVCKHLRELAQPVLWELVEMDQDSKGSVGDVIRVLSTINRRPDLARHVKGLSFRHWMVDDCFRTFPASFTPNEERSLAPILQCDQVHQISSLLNQLPNLQSLKIVLETIPDYWDVFSPSPISLFPSGYPLGLQNLTEFSFHWEDPDVDAHCFSLLLPLFLLPSLKTLNLGHPMALAGKENIRKADFTRHIGRSTVTTLIIDFGLIATPALDMFLQLPAALESFTYTYGGGSIRCSNAQFGEYLHALLPQRTTLKSLKIRGCRDLQDECAPRPGILKSFTALEEFSCPARLLLFKKPFYIQPYNHRNETHKLEDALPPSLEAFTLYAYDDWTFNGVSEEIKRFLQFGKRHHPKLKKLRADCWLHEHDYKPHGADGDKADALNVIQSQVEMLKQRGKDNEVEIEVKLDTILTTSILV